MLLCFFDSFPRRMFDDPLRMRVGAVLVLFEKVLGFWEVYFAVVGDVVGDGFLDKFDLIFHKLC